MNAAEKTARWGGKEPGSGLGWQEQSRRLGLKKAPAWQSNPTRMNNRFCLRKALLSVVVASLWFGPGWGGAHAADASLDEDAALAALAAYRFGDSRQRLTVVEKWVAATAANPSARERLAAKLASKLTANATLEARQFLCRQLSLIGSGSQVPVLAGLLADTNLVDHARLALERIPGEEAETALLNALTTASGRARLGVISSLAARHSQKAVAPLTALAKDPAPDLAGAALEALGQIGGPQAAHALLTARPGCPPPLQPRLDAALLQCAEQLLTAGNTKEAAPILEQLSAPSQPPHLRLAAFPAYVASLGDQGTALVLSALTGTDQGLQAAAIRALRATSSPALVQAAANRLSTLSPDLQVQVIGLCGERGPSAALPALTLAATSQTASIRRAALAALGPLGDETTVPVLVRLLDSANAEERALMVAALVRLRGQAVEGAMVVALKKSSPLVQTALLEALATRGANAAVPAFLEAAAHPAPPVRLAALAALEKLGDLSVCSPLIGLLTQPHDAEALEATLASICRRAHSLDPVLTALPGSTGTKQASLLAVLGSVGGPRALKVVLTALRSPEPETRTTAARVLAYWPDAAPLADLASLAMTTPDLKMKVLALRGLARLAPLAKDQPPEKVVTILDQALTTASTQPEQMALLGALGELPGLPALRAAAARLQTSNLAEEAGLTALKIIDEIGAKHRAEAQTALAQVAAACQSPAVAGRLAALHLKFGDFHNLALGATASSPDGLDSDGQAGGDQAAIDGNPKTYWDEVDNQKLYRLRVQLQQRSKVAILRIMGFQHQHYAPKDFEVLCDDRVVKKVENARYQQNLLTLEIPPTECTTLELKITGSYGPSPAIRELEIYSVAPRAAERAPLENKPKNPNQNSK